MNLIFLFLGTFCLLIPALNASPNPEDTWTWGKRQSKKVVPKDKNIPRPFFPFFKLGARAGPNRPDGTYKDRAVQDTLPSSPMDTYTTLDKLQGEPDKNLRFEPTRRQVRAELGGLHPEEVFYVDDDLIIIKGGGFHKTNTFSEPSQNIDDETFFAPSYGRQDFSPQEEYNGNIPAFLPPPLPLTNSKPSPLSLFFPSASTTNHRFALPPVPHANFQRGSPLDTPTIIKQCTYHHISPQRILVSPFQFVAWPGFNNLLTSVIDKVNFNKKFNKIKKPHYIKGRPVQIGHPLYGDTNVNNYPNLPINPDAAIFDPSEEPLMPTSEETESPSNSPKGTPEGSTQIINDNTSEFSTTKLEKNNKFPQISDKTSTFYASSSNPELIIPNKRLHKLKKTPASSNFKRQPK